MTPNEIEFLLGIAVACFPSSQKQDMGPTFEAWNLFLGHLSFDVGKAALGKHVISGAKFVPSPGEILSYADDILNPKRPSAAEAWAEVMHAVRFIGRNNTPTWPSEAIKKSVEGLGGWQVICDSENQMADRAHFMRLYDVESRREKEKAMLPPAIRNLIARIQAESVPCVLPDSNGSTHTHQLLKDTSPTPPAMALSG